MARARNIKPGFFKNEDLAECSLAARLCFAGLWTLAHRDGRLEDRPKRIKGELFAYDSVEVEPLLKELQRHGFIDRYAVDAVAVIQILNFYKHQTPHFKEPPSGLPPKSLGLDPHSMTPKPEALPPSKDQQTQGKTGAGPPSNDTKAEELPDKTEVYPQLKGGSEPPESGSRIPDTGSRIPDTGLLIPDTGEGKARKRATPPPNRPDDVDEQTWADWLQLRKGKHAAVTSTVIAEARTESEKAGLSLERFLAIWCSRGSQGLQADWLKPNERGHTNGNGETAYQRSMRERMQAVCPSIAAKNPNQKPTAEVFDVSSRSLDR